MTNCSYYRETWRIFSSNIVANVGKISEKTKAILAIKHAEKIAQDNAGFFRVKFVSSSTEFKTVPVTVKLGQSLVRMQLRMLLKFEEKRLQCELSNCHHILIFGSCFVKGQKTQFEIYGFCPIVYLRYLRFYMLSSTLRVPLA